MLLLGIVKRNAIYLDQSPAGKECEAGSRQDFRIVTKRQETLNRTMPVFTSFMAQAVHLH